MNGNSLRIVSMYKIYFLILPAGFQTVNLHHLYILINIYFLFSIIFRRSCHLLHHRHVNNTQAHTVDSLLSHLMILKTVPQQLTLG